MMMMMIMIIIMIMKMMIMIISSQCMPCQKGNWTSGLRSCGQVTIFK